MKLIIWLYINTFISLLYLKIPEVSLLVDTGLGRLGLQTYPLMDWDNFSNFNISILYCKYYHVLNLIWALKFLLAFIKQYGLIEFINMLLWTFRVT